MAKEPANVRTERPDEMPTLQIQVLWTDTERQATFPVCCWARPTTLSFRLPIGLRFRNAEDCIACDGPARRAGQRCAPRTDQPKEDFCRFACPRASVSRPALFFLPVTGGGYAVARAWSINRGYLPVARMPVFAGFQQFAEGNVWWGMNTGDPGTTLAGALVFIFFHGSCGRSGFRVQAMCFSRPRVDGTRGWQRWRWADWPSGWHFTFRICSTPIGSRF